MDGYAWIAISSLITDISCLRLGGSTLTEIARLFRAGGSIAAGIGWSVITEKFSFYVFRFYNCSDVNNWDCLFRACGSIITAGLINDIACLSVLTIAAGMITDFSF